MGEFSPVQLDALEDALEDLELIGIPGDLEDDPSVSGRLSEYRGLLQLSREALPLEDVPTGVLANVLALAREEAAEAATAATPKDDDVAAAQPWWKRLSLWVPMLAVGASAALVLVMVRGTLSDAKSEPEGVVASASKADDAAKKEEAQADGAGPLLQRADELQAVAEPPADGDDDMRLGGLETRGRLRGSAATDMPASEVVSGEAEPEEDAEAEPPAEAEEASAEKKRDAQSGPAVVPTDPTDKVVYDGKNAKTPSKKSSGSSSSTKLPSSPAKPKPSPQPAPEPEPTPSAGGGNAGGKGTVPGGLPDANKDAETPSDPLAGAERERKAGRCGTARSSFNAHLDDADASVRARALAGLGLCALAEGDSKTADDYFSRAKKADGSVAGFISRERAKLEPAKKQSL